MGLALDPSLSTVLIYYFFEFFKFIIVYVFNPRINKVIIILIRKRKFKNGFQDSLNHFTTIEMRKLNLAVITTCTVPISLMKKETS